MNRIYFLALAILIAGCGTPVARVVPEPSISVIRLETATTRLNVTVWIKDHQMLVSNDKIYAVSANLKDADTIAKYKNQISFLMSQLEEVETKMRAREYPTTGNPTNAIIVVEFNGSNWLNVRFQGHQFEYRHEKPTGNAFVEMNTLSEVIEYKKQVSFLYRLLEDSTKSIEVEKK